MIFQALCFFTVCFILKCEAFYATNITTQKVITEYVERPTTITRRLDVIDIFPKDKKLHPKTNRKRPAAVWQDGRRKIRKNNNKSILIWDHYCRYQMQVGNCQRHVERYYYNVLLNKCQNFTYSGCKGNQNNFASIEECEQRCADSTFAYIKPEEFTYVCRSQYEPGLCLGLMQRYYYDINEKKCLKFTYGGCGGNKNNFKYETECVQTCITDLVNENANKS